MTVSRLLQVFSTAAFNSNTRQKLLAFASLLGLLFFFTVASPGFMQADSMVGLLLATAVYGVLAVARTTTRQASTIPGSRRSCVTHGCGSLRAATR